MKKVISIEGMHCPKCAGRVENALNTIENVSAKVNLAKKNAVVTLKGEVSDSEMTKAIEELGFKVVSITEKKGLLG